MNDLSWLPKPSSLIVSNLFGMRLISDKCMIEQYRFPRCKKKRVRKKWTKDLKNFRPIKTSYLLTGSAGSTLVGHPILIFKMKEELC